ncbi:MAG TPA: ATP-grasp domain-containing protein [Stellaceae bacterium]|nr:ATP-grasp domain-containing protein [Stellaceae bacterium]
MLLYEHEGKSLLREYDIPIPEGFVIRADTLKAPMPSITTPLMVKAQILAGGRGKVGGILAASHLDEARSAANHLLESEIASHKVKLVLIEQQQRVAREFYVAITFDGSEILLLIGSEGGMEVETFFSGERRAIEAIRIDPLYGLSEYQVRNALERLAVSADLWAPFAGVSRNLFRLFRGSDAKLAEINPLALTAEGVLIALDARIEVDEAAFFRQPRFATIAQHRRQGDGIAARLCDIGVQYVPMGGDIGLVSQGAGAGVTIMDWVVREGGRLAAFVDVDYAILSGKTEEALRMTLGYFLSEKSIRSIIINFTTCGVRLDVIANDLIKVLNDLREQRSIPLFIHLDGNRVDVAHWYMEAAGFPLCPTLGDAVRGACRAIVRQRP